MADRNYQRLLHAYEAISSVKEFCQDKTFEDFRDDDLFYSAVLQKFLIIGESITRIDKEVLEKYVYPWHKPRAFRNFIAHEYFRVKPERIWETIRADLPGLEKIILIVLKEEFHHEQ
jgi:uncharacterized protein with HEPN domain